MITNMMEFMTKVKDVFFLFNDFFCDLYLLDVIIGLLVWFY